MVQDFIKVFEANKISIENFAVQKTATPNPFMRVYVRDPDGNLIETSNPI